MQASEFQRVIASEHVCVWGGGGMCVCVRVRSWSAHVCTGATTKNSICFWVQIQDLNCLR
jgi:hypothetical protein